jgi:HPt (histidine-containing phosphotransfer) domain-containing protein
MNDLDAALARIWDRSKPLTRERLARIDAAVAALGQSRLTDPAVEDATHAAHQLAGSLGTFGLNDGTLLARQIEAQLKEARDPSCVADLLARLRALLEPRLAGDLEAG